MPWLEEAKLKLETDSPLFDKIVFKIIEYYFLKNMRGS